MIALYILTAYNLNEHTCTATIEAQNLSISSNVERVAEYFMNVAKTVKDFP